MFKGHQYRHFKHHVHIASTDFHYNGHPVIGSSSTLHSLMIRPHNTSHWLQQMTTKNTLECPLIVTSNRPYCRSQWVNRGPHLLTFTDYTLHYITLSKSGSEMIFVQIYMWPKFLGQTFYPTDGQTVFLNINSFIHENRLAFDCPWTITTINHCDPTLSCMNPKIYLIDWLIEHWYFHLGGIL